MLWATSLFVYWKDKWTHFSKDTCAYLQRREWSKSCVQDLLLVDRCEMENKSCVCICKCTYASAVHRCCNKGYIHTYYIQAKDLRKNITNDVLELFHKSQETCKVILLLPLVCQKGLTERHQRSLGVALQTENANEENQAEEKEVQYYKRFATLCGEAYVKQYSVCLFVIIAKICYYSQAKEMRRNITNEVLELSHRSQATCKVIIFSNLFCQRGWTGSHQRSLGVALQT